MAVTSGPQCSLNLQHSSIVVRVSKVHSRLYTLQMDSKTTVQAWAMHAGCRRACRTELQQCFTSCLDTFLAIA